MVTVTVEHKNTSTAEARNVCVTLYVTGFFNVSRLLYCNVSDTLQVTPEVTIDNDAKTARLEVRSNPHLTTLNLAR